MCRLSGIGATVGAEEKRGRGFFKSIEFLLGLKNPRPLFSGPPSVVREMNGRRRMRLLLSG